MARKSNKSSVYERITDKELEIKLTEESLQKLNSELVILINEKDDLEMRELFAYARSNGITLEQIKVQCKKTV